MTQGVLILGASGKIGAHASRAFVAAGWDVRHFDRKRHDMKKAAEGVAVIVNGLNPPNYHSWDTLIPKITADVIAAAKHSGSTVILPGNVYNFGASGGVWDENTAQIPAARKGRIRVDMEQAYKVAGIQTLILRAGNFIDPDKNSDVFSMVLMRSFASGKVTYPGDADSLQAYCYLPDWARAAVLLAEGRETLAQFEDVPFGGLAFTANGLKQHLQAMTGKPVRIVGFPWALMRIASPFWELARELLDMRYLWSTSHSLADEKLRRLLPDFRITPLDDVLKDVSGL